RLVEVVQVGGAFEVGDVERVGLTGAQPLQQRLGVTVSPGADRGGFGLARRGAEAGQDAPQLGGRGGEALPARGEGAAKVDALRLGVGEEGRAVDVYAHQPQRAFGWKITPGRSGQRSQAAVSSPAMRKPGRAFTASQASRSPVGATPTVTR